MTGSDLAEAKSSLGGGLKVAASAADGFANAVKTAFVDGLNLAGIIAASVVLAAAVIVRLLLPSRPRGPLTTPEVAAPVAVD